MADFVCKGTLWRTHCRDFANAVRSALIAIGRSQMAYPRGAATTAFYKHRDEICLMFCAPRGHLTIPCNFTDIRTQISGGRVVNFLGRHELGTLTNATIFESLVHITHRRAGQ